MTKREEFEAALRAYGAVGYDARYARVLELYDEALVREYLSGRSDSTTQQPWADEAELAEALRGVFGEFVDNGGNACEAWLACARVALQRPEVRCTKCGYLLYDDHCPECAALAPQREKE